MNPEATSRHLYHASCSHHEKLLNNRGKHRYTIATRPHIGPKCHKTGRHAQDSSHGRTDLEPRIAPCSMTLLDSIMFHGISIHTVGAPLAFQRNSYDHPMHCAMPCAHAH